MNVVVSRKKTKILHIITRGILGGAQKHILYLASSLIEDFDVHVGIGVRGFLFERLEERGIAVYHIPSLVKKISPLQDIKALYQIIKLIKKVNPDLVCFHSSKAGILGRIAAHICRIPVIFTAHGWAFTEGVPVIQRYVYVTAERIAARWTDKIICVSEYDRQLALRNNVGGNKQLVTVHNGIPQIPEGLLANPGKKQPVKLIMVARFSEPKDYPLLFQAIRELDTKNDYIVELVGDGPLLGQCKDMVKQLGIGDRIDFLGERTNIPELLKRSQVFVLASKWEGFPLSIVEAMRAGLPVVASDVGGVRESVVDGITGYLVLRSDCKMLKEKLKSLIDDPDLRDKMGDNGRERFLNYFTFEQMVNKSVAVYNEVLHKSCGGS